MGSLAEMRQMGGGLVLLDNGGDDKLITSDGQFQFATGVQLGTTYATGNRVASCRCRATTPPIAVPARSAAR
ncbi:MAG TPA: hypothetical protein VF403_02450 [Kofleriaceae bacterium]